MKLRLGLALGIALLAAATSAGQAEEVRPAQRLSPKLGVRLGYGTLNNSNGTSTGMTFRGVDAYFSYYFTSTLGLGVGYQIDPPFSGGRLFGRYYFYGDGTRSVSYHPLVTRQRHDRFAFYGGGEIAQKNYSYPLPRQPDSLVAESLSGSTAAVNLLIGADHRINSHFDINAEISFGALSLYSSDERISLLGQVFFFGISYLW